MTLPKRLWVLMLHQCFRRNTKVKTAYDHMQPLHLNNFVKMQPGLYLPILSCHTGLLVACLALGSTTWLRPPCFYDVVCQAEQIAPHVLFDQVPLMYLTTARLCYVSFVGVRLAFSQRVHCETCTSAFFCQLRNQGQLELQSTDSTRQSGWH